MTGLRGGPSAWRTSGGSTHGGPVAASKGPSTLIEMDPLPEEEKLTMGVKSTKL
jgi:hypothetical protein